MMEYKDDMPDPEQGWKDAEKLLDRHFKKKKERKGIAWLCLTLGVIFIGFYFIDYKSSSTPGLVVEKEKLKKADVEQKKFSDDLKNGNAVMTQPDKGKILPVSEDLLTQKKRDEIKLNDNESFVGKETSFGITSTYVNKPGTLFSPALTHVKETQDSLQTQHEEIKFNEFPDTLHHTLAIEKQVTYNISLMPLIQIATDHDTGHDVSLFRSGYYKLKFSPHWDVFVYGNFSAVSKEIKGSSDQGYLQRRKNEEKGTWLPGVGFQFSHSKNKWDMRVGAELNILGEKVEYSPFSKGEYYHNYQVWHNYEYSYSDIDTMYIFGVPVYQTKTVTAKDSLLVDKTDTLNGVHYNENISAASGMNKYYVLEIPIDIAYYFKRAHFSYGVMGGISTGMVIRSEGNYLRNDEHAIAIIGAKDHYDVLLSLRAGVEFSYMLNEKVRIKGGPMLRYYVRGVSEREGGDKFYRGIGLSAGVFYSFR